MPSRRQATTSPPSPSQQAPASQTTGGRRTGIFHRESTRLRSNVADQVQRDLLPAGRMLSIFLILCELLAEVAVLVWSRGQKCDRPLRFWVQVLIVLQTGTVVLNCLNIWQGRDSFGQHRNGLSATDIDMYTDAPATEVISSATPTALSSPDRPTSTNVVVDVSTHDRHNAYHSHMPSAPSHSYDDLDTQPLLCTRPSTGLDPQSSSALASIPSTFLGFASTSSPASSSSPPNQEVSYAHNGMPSSLDTPRITSANSPNAPSSLSSDGLEAPNTNSILMGTSPSLSSLGSPRRSGSTFISTEFVDKYVRMVNASYLIWFILGSIWVSDGSTCSATAPHLYRLIVALTIIYYALLFLPLACFCLIVCCLPLFILVYRIMLPYAERQRRRERAADPAQVQSLNSIAYSPDTFTSHTGSHNLDDASCVICLCDYEENEIVRFLPCNHHFHKDCVDVWLRLDKACCLCKQDIDAQTTTPSTAATATATATAAAATTATAAAPVAAGASTTTSASPTPTPATTVDLSV